MDDDEYTQVDDVYNVEGNIHAPLLGRDLDSSTPWRSHQNAWIRTPTRFVVRAEEISGIGAFILTLWYGIPQTISAIGEVLWQGVLATPSVLWRNRFLLPVLVVILVAGGFLVYQGSKGELNIFLMLFFAWAMIIFAVVARLQNRGNSYDSGA